LAGFFAEFEVPSLLRAFASPVPDPSAESKPSDADAVGAIKEFDDAPLKFT
jgi:hypothetical protein